MTSYVLQDKETGKYLKGSNAWQHTLTDDLQQARIYVNKNAANRSATNIPRYAKYPLPVFEMKTIKIILSE